MFRVVLIVCIFFIKGIFFVTANELKVPEGQTISPMLRSTHFVNDIEESLKLYRDILGLEIRADLILEGDRANQVLGTQNEKVRAVVLKSGDLYNGGLGLFQFLDKISNKEIRVDAFAKPGDSVLVFITNDIFEVYNKVKQDKYLIASSPMVLFPKKDDEKQDYEMLFYDRDGIGVNLIQRSVNVIN